MPSTVLTAISFVADELALEIVQNKLTSFRMALCSVDLMPFEKVTDLLHDSGRRDKTVLSQLDSSVAGNKL